MYNIGQEVFLCYKHIGDSKLEITADIVKDVIGTIGGKNYLLSANSGAYSEHCLYESVEDIKTKLFPSIGEQHGGSSWCETQG